jgi:hypothetical protein
MYIILVKYNLAHVLTFWTLAHMAISEGLGEVSFKNVH